MTLKFSIDGVILDPGEAFLPLPDDGLLRGDGVFEVARIYRGIPFALDLHLDRMEKSAAAIELSIDRQALESETASIIKLAPEECLIRLVVTREGRRVLSIEELPEHSPTITLQSVTYSPTLILDGVKSLSYGANMQATRLAKAAGADEALFVRPDGMVLEPPTSSIFWVTCDGTLRTPALETGVLDSITRRAIIEGTEVEEGQFQFDDLMSASEAFLASTTREAHPVSRIDEKEMPVVNGDGTREAARVFNAALESDLRKAHLE